jgi:dynactin complex subunit
MDEPIDSLTRLLADVILPNLQSVQGSQAEQIAANARLENALEELRACLKSQFAQLSAQLSACRVELAVTQLALKAAQARNGKFAPERVPLVH